MGGGTKRRDGGVRNGSLTIIVLTPLTTILAACSRASELVRMLLMPLEYFLP
jgi:hypothetical protein